MKLTLEWHRHVVITNVVIKEIIVVEMNSGIHHRSQGREWEAEERNCLEQQSEPHQEEEQEM